MILSLVSKKAKSDTWSIFFSTRCRTSDKNKIDQVSDLAVFLLAVVFDELLCSTKGFSTRSRAPITEYIFTPSKI